MKRDGAGIPTFVPVYTLHDMKQETGEISAVPVVICSGCQHPIPSPRGSARIQCRDCGKKMHIVGIRPAMTSDQATPG